MYSQEYYQPIQDTLLQVVRWLKVNVADESYADIEQYIQANELGLALGDVISILQETAVAIPPYITETIIELKRTMSIK